MTKTITTPELTLSIIGDWFKITRDHNGKTWNSLSTPELEKVMSFAEMYNFGEFGNRETFEGYVMWRMEINQALEVL